MWRHVADADSYTYANANAYNEQTTAGQHLCNSDIGNEPAIRNLQLSGE
jgi:hypothetical protein